MPISQSDHVFNLVKSLTKAEKRNFKLYVSRLGGDEDALFVQLFDELDKAECFKEREIRSKLDQISASQLSNLKRHLYSQILTSLRLIHHKRDISLRIREQMDFAQILYNKGLYMQSLKLLDRVRSMAKSANEDLLLFEIIEHQKMIEEKHITRSRSIANKMENLIDDSEYYSSVVQHSSSLANLKLKTHGLYIQIGHVKDENQAASVKDFFYKNLPKLEKDNLRFLERVYLNQSYVWYYYILLDFEHCLEHSKEWVNAFLHEDTMIRHNPDSYMRGLHYMITCQFHLKDREGYQETLKLFKAFREEYHQYLNKTSKTIFFLYYNYAKVDYFILTGLFKEGILSIPGVKKRLTHFREQVDAHRILTFYYRFAWLHFANEDYGIAIDYLNEVLNLKVPHLREDIQCYSWMLFILAHWELGHFRLLSHLVDSAARFFNKMKNHNDLQKVLMAFIRTQLKPGINPHREILDALKTDLERIRNDRYQRKALLYLDAIHWVESKLQRKPISVIIAEEWEAEKLQ